MLGESELKPRTKDKPLTHSRSKYFDVFNSTSNGNVANHVLAVELDTLVPNQKFGDINDNHVGININGLNSIISRLQVILIILVTNFRF